MYPELQKELETFERRTAKSAEAHQRNRKRLPLGVASNYRAYDPYPIFVQDAQGSHFRDLDGNEYLDHNLCFGALMAGHCHPAVMKAVEKRLSTGTMLGMPHNMEWELAEEVCNRFPVEMCRFGNSGTEATMHSIRLARAATARDKIIKFEGGYHGLHDSALVSVKPHPPKDDLGDIKNPKAVPGGLGVPKASIANVLIATFNDLETVERRFKENSGEIAAIILEPIMMNVGLCMPQKGFLEGLRRICDAHGILLVFDEVQSGMGRTGKMFAADHYGAKADIVCIAKGIASGLPLCACVARADVMDWKPGAHASTFGGNPVAIAAALKTIELLERELVANAAEVGAYLKRGLEKLMSKHDCIGDVRGMGFMLGVEFVKNRATKEPDAELRDRVEMASFNRGLILLGAGSNSIRWSPPLILTQENVDVALEIFDEAVAASI